MEEIKNTAAEEAAEQCEATDAKSEQSVSSSSYISFFSAAATSSSLLGKETIPPINEESLVSLISDEK